MTQADRAIEASAAVRAVFNQSRTIMDGYLDACEARDAYHVNLANRTAEKLANRRLPIEPPCYAPRVAEKTSFSLNYAAICPWFACAVFWGVVGYVIAASL